MSGFEIAGIVLAVIPLLLSGLDAYPDSKLLKFAKSFTRAKLERREFARRLTLLHTELRFAMLDIFKQINLILTHDQRRALTASDSVGPAKFFAVWNEVWETKSSEIKEILEHTIEPIEKVLTHMVELLNAMVKHTNISSDAGKDTLRSIIENQEDPNFSITKNLSRRFKFAASDSKRQGMIELLKEDIELLKSLNKGQELTRKFIAAGNIIEAQKSHHVFLDRVRGHCDNLYHGLTNIWQCECHKSPSALLRLEWRETPEQHKANDLRFSVILNFRHVSADDQELWASRETEMRVHPK
jgi:polyhydroxyalkanoate synthesis regulator phasin